MRSYFLLLLCLAACKHDADDLAPDVQRDIGAWLMLADPACEECVVSECSPSAQACLEDEECRVQAKECTPVDPGCAQRSFKVRDIAVCLAKTCRDVCVVPEQSLSCLGTFPWREPKYSGPVEFEEKLNGYGGFPYAGVARVATCFGPEVTCEDAQAMSLMQEQIVRAQYSFTLGPMRPYFRITGDGLRTMLFYEDANISTGYQINIPAVAESTYQGLLALLGAPELAGRGTLDFVMFDCTGKELAGVKFEVSRVGMPLGPAELGTPYYFDEMFPRDAASQPQTASKGQGGFINLPPGLYDASAFLNGKQIATIASVRVQESVITHVNLMPLSLDEVAAAPP